MNCLDGVGGALADHRPVHVQAAHARRGGERHELVLLAELALAQAELLLGEHDDRAALGRLVGERCELRDLGELEHLDARERQELGRLAVAERDRARLVEQQDVDVARCLHRAAGHREHVALHQPVHAGDADRREQGADRRRDEGDEQRDENGLGQRRARVIGERRQRDRRDDERDRERREQDVERNLVRRLAALGTLDEGDHAVEERAARLLRDLDHQPVGEQPRAAGHGRAVAARLADHRGGLARDRGLVDRAHAFDDLAVGGDDLARLDDDDVTALEVGRGDLLQAAGVGSAEGHGRRARGPAARSPGPCRVPRRRLRRSWRTAPSATARARSCP